MAKTSKARGVSSQSNSYNSYVSNDSVGMDNDDDRTFFVYVIVILMAVILLFIPLLAWMYIDVKMMEIRVNKALVKIEGK
jgi:uncharacterized membrane protein